MARTLFITPPVRLPGEGASALVTTAMWGFLAAGTAFALLAPSLFWLLLAGTAALGVGFLAFRYTVACCAVWLLIAGSTLEMAIGDLMGPSVPQAIIAMVKSAQIGLAVVCVLRFGPRLDPFNPALAFATMGAIGFARGLHVSLTPVDSIRSLVGSMAPYVFAFSRLSLPWARAILVTTRWIPIITVAAGAVLAAAGIRPLFIELGGARLGGLGHPAFLGGFCLTAIYASLIELFRDGRDREVALMAVNLVLLAATGARAPLIYGMAVCLLSLLFVPSAAFPWRRRLTLLLAGGAALPVLAVLAGELSGLRLFGTLSGSHATDLSGRDILWPPFEDAAAQSPWFGWGVGAGNAVIPVTSDVALLIGTQAAHNEYLRMRVEGGWFGLGLLICCFVGWVWMHSARLRPAERTIMRLVFVAFACHAFTDNLLISTSACVFFAFAVAVFARGALEASEVQSAVRGDDAARELA
jgi:O-antigen ligase